jgi:hypothetical protein
MQQSKLQLQQTVDAAIRDEAEAIQMYQKLADSFQAWVNTLPPAQQGLYQNDVNQVRFIQGDEIRHRTLFQGMRARL